MQGVVSKIGSHGLKTRAVAFVVHTVAQGRPVVGALVWVARVVWQAEVILGNLPQNTPDCRRRLEFRKGDSDEILDLIIRRSSMYSYEERMKAIELYIRYDRSVADTI